VVSAGHVPFSRDIHVCVTVHLPARFPNRHIGDCLENIPISHAAQNNGGLIDFQFD
jgi:hypothetical protein